MLRYSLGSLFLVLLYLSVGCAALVNSSGVWPQAAVTLTIAILVLFSLAAVFWDQRRRVFAIGFSATGWLYFLLVFSSVTNVRPYLLTESATNWLFTAIHGDQAGPHGVAWETVVSTGGPARVQRVVYAAPVRVPPPLPPTGYANSPAPGYAPAVARAIPVDYYSFGSIGHSLWAVIAAFIGGVTAQALYARSRRRKVVVESEEESGS